MQTDTIAAIATAVSDSGIGIIRISGSDALLVADKVYRSPKNQKKLSQAASHTIHYGYIYDEDELIDEVMVQLCVVLTVIPQKIRWRLTVGGILVMTVYWKLCCIMEQDWRSRVNLPKELSKGKD